MKTMGWDYETYMAQPLWLIEQTLTCAMQEEMERKRTNQSLIAMISGGRNSRTHNRN